MKKFQIQTLIDFLMKTLYSMAEKQAPFKNQNQEQSLVLF